MTIVSAQSRFQHHSLLKTLMAKKIISADQAKIAEVESHKQNIDLKTALKRLGFCSETLIQEIVAKQASAAPIDLSQTMLDTSLLATFPKNIAQRHKILPISLTDGVLVAACVDPTDLLALDQVRMAYPQAKDIKLLTATGSEISQAIWNYYDHDFTLEHILDEINQAPFKPEDLSYDNPVVRLVDTLLFEAVNLGASDIHLEPEDYHIRVRYRLDGVLNQKLTLHKTFWAAVVVRIKIMAGMDIAETRKPQSGRISKYFCDREVDLRISSHPTIQGENIVIRILDKKVSLKPLNQLGFLPDQVAALKAITKRPGGINIITGPTGSGKTTTLYSLLNYISSLEVNIMTLEQPVEYKLPLIRQTEIPENSYINYADAIRSILRQDPDIIYIAEIRDEESAKMALRAAMTGHQVYTTLHTNTAEGAIQRLKDLGVMESELQDNISSVMAQRLVRKLCPACRTYKDGEYQAKGCSNCHGTGYKGRLPLTEILVFNKNKGLQKKCSFPKNGKKNIQTYQMVSNFLDNSRELIHSGATTSEEIKKTLGEY